MKTAIICIARNENLYIREWVEHHLRLGFDKIIVCDNGFGNEESPIVALKGLERFVEVLDWRNMPHPQVKAYEDTYGRFSNQFDWFAFFDIDEFLLLEKDRTVGEFLGRFPKDCKLVSVNWEIMTDNGLLKYDGKPVMERFTEPMAKDKCVAYNFPENRHVKVFVKGGLGKISFPGNIHTINIREGSYHSNLRRETSSPFHNIDYTYAKLRHFVTKTIEEWCTIRVPRGRADAGRPMDTAKFFKYNDKTQGKVKIFQKFFPNTRI